MSPKVFGPIAAAIQDSGTVDYFWVWDQLQLTSWYPQAGFVAPAAADSAVS